MEWYCMQATKIREKELKAFEASKSELDSSLKASNGVAARIFERLSGESQNWFKRTFAGALWFFLVNTVGSYKLSLLLMVYIALFFVFIVSSSDTTPKIADTWTTVLILLVAVCGSLNELLVMISRYSIWMYLEWICGYTYYIYSLIWSYIVLLLIVICI